MSTNKYEKIWNNREPSQRKELLLQWASGTIPLSNEQLLFSLNKVVVLSDVELSNKYIDYLNQFVFNDENRSRALIQSLSFDYHIAFVLFALSRHIADNFKLILILKEKFPYISLDSGHHLPKTKAIFIDIEASIFRYIKAFTFADDTSISDFNKLLFLLFSNQLMDSTKRYIDWMFENRSQYAQLSKLYEHIQKFKSRHEFIRTLSLSYLSSLAYLRANREEEQAANDLFIRIASFVDIPPEKRSNLFQKIQVVLKNIVSYPDPDKEDELEEHFNNISRLDEQIVSEFLVYLFKSDSGLGQQLYKKMDPKSDLYKKCSKHIPKQPTKVQKPSVEDNESVEGSEQDGSVSDHSDSELETSEHDHDTSDELELDYFKAEEWDFKLSLLTPAMFNTTSDKTSDELINALNSIAQHARKHLTSKATSVRAKEGRKKYGELMDLFSEFGSIKSNSTEDALRAARDILMERLDKDPEKSNLLKNRKGFFEAYKSVSKCLSAVGVKHFKYKDRTAESTTDHLLILLLDTINDELKSLDVSVEVTVD